MILECIICLDTKYYVTKTSCNHNICVDCLFKIKEVTCPMCRKDLSKELPKIVKDSIIKNKQERTNNESINNEFLHLNDDYEFPPL